MKKSQPVFECKHRKVLVYVLSYSIVLYCSRGVQLFSFQLNNEINCKVVEEGWCISNDLV